MNEALNEWLLSERTNKQTNRKQINEEIVNVSLNGPEEV